MNRRRFIGGVAATGAAAAAGPSFWRAAYGAPTTAGPGPYGELQPPDANGLMLPVGFTSRVIATSGRPVPGTDYVWPPFPDGAAIFPADDGGWFHAVNSEVSLKGGGASAIRYDAAGEVVDAYRILSQTTGNCAGGATPWGTWLSCEETQSPSNIGEGLVWECDPTKPGQGVARPAMGAFNHEAVAVDPIRKRLYLTEDRSDGRFYRFTPTAYPDMSAGLLEAATVDADGNVSWSAVPDPSASTRTTRTQLPQSTPFKGGEGCWYDRGFVYFTTKGDNRVWSLDTRTDTLEIIYDATAFGSNPPLTGVDNIIVSKVGELFVAEDGGNMEIVVIDQNRVIAPVVRYPGNSASEIAGPVFDPSGSRLYFSSQRGPAPAGPGVTFEVRGPFTGAVVTTPPTAPAAPEAMPGPAPGGGGSSGTLPATGGPSSLSGAAALAAGAALVAVRRRLQG